jgi:hypothetical protein
VAEIHARFVPILQMARLFHEMKGLSMSFVTVDSEMLAATAANLAGISSAVAAGNSAAAAPTTGVIPAAADQVSVLTATQFAGYGHLYQVVSSQAHTVFHLLINTLQDNAGSYAATEAANTVALGG